jgi:hypothetical protein
MNEKINKITPIKDYQICGYTIPKGTILTYIGKDEIGESTYQDPDGRKIVFDNSELLFSGAFHNVI